MTTLGELMLEAQPGFACGAEDENGIFQFRMNNVTNESTVDLSKRRRVPLDAHKSMAKFFVARHDVLFNATNSPDNVGKSVLVPQLDENAVFSNHFIRLRVNPERLYPAYLWRWLQWNFHRGLFGSMCRQWVNQATVSREALLKLEVPLPSLDEQRRIAGILDQADAVLGMRRKAVVPLDELESAIFLDASVQHDGYGEEHLLGDIAEVVTGFAFKSREFVKGGTGAVRLCRGANVLPGRLDWSDLAQWPQSRQTEFEKFSLAAGDVVVAMDRPWITEGFKIAKVSEVDCPALLVQRVARIRANGKANNEFIYAALNSPEFERYCRPTETTIPHISPIELRNFPIKLPPEEVLHEFVNRQTEVAMLRARCVAAAKEAQALFASLQSRAFSGQL